jgi:hypothetical protein
VRRVVHKSTTFDDADEHDVRQQLAMTPQERVDVARELQQRFCGPVKDIRRFHAVRKSHAAGRLEGVDSVRFFDQREG